MDMFGLRQREWKPPLHQTSFFMYAKTVGIKKKSAKALLGTQANGAVGPHNREYPRSSSSGTFGPAAEAWQLLVPR